MIFSYDNPWLYDNKVFESENIEDYYGFVYLIENKINERKYVGRKYFNTYRTVKGKKRKERKESDWKKYYGSCPELHEDIKKFGKENFNRIILSLHKTKGKTNFEETRQLFLHGVLTESIINDVPKFYNSNILNRYFRKDYFNK